VQTVCHKEEEGSYWKDTFTRQVAAHLQFEDGSTAIMILNKICNAEDKMMEIPPPIPIFPCIAPDLLPPPPPKE
jgi:hypothetical protein